jgi:hypothetical protein
MNTKKRFLKEIDNAKRVIKYLKQIKKHSKKCNSFCKDKVCKRKCNQKYLTKKIMDLKKRGALPGCYRDSL